jgi:CBS domain-containing protein
MHTLETLISSPIRTTSPDATVLEAVSAMCRWHVRSLVVGEPGKPEGIVCERDILERVVLERRDPATTSVREIMTAPLVWVHADLSPEDALDAMDVHHLHQVPIQGDEALIGVVSRPDLTRRVLRDREHEVAALMSYVSGT